MGRTDINMADVSGSSNIVDEDKVIIKNLIDSNNRMGKEMQYLKSRLSAVEVQQRQQPLAAPPALRSATISVSAAAASDLEGVGDGSVSERAVTISENSTAAAVNRGFKWRGSQDLAIDMLDIPTTEAAMTADDDGSDLPPMRKIKFLDPSPQIADEVNNSKNNNNKQKGDASVASSSTYSSEEDPIAFSGWARCFFQARHHLASTQITLPESSTTSQDTYLHVTIHTTANELRISNTDDRWQPSLIDPPIQLKHFYAAKVPGSRSGAALFLKNDLRRLRKYIFRFEFVNRAVHQPPARYVHFRRSGKAAKNSMRSMSRVRDALKKTGEEQRENLKEHKKRAQDAFAAHLGTLDELLRESDEAAERFVECFNARNEEMDELALSQRGLIGRGIMGDSSADRRKRTKPPPPYWGSGFNRPNINDEDDDDPGVDSDSNYSEDEEDLYYVDENDDETFFDRVQVSTAQSLETLFNHIVK